MIVYLIYSSEKGPWFNIAQLPVQIVGVGPQHNDENMSTHFLW